MPGWFEISSNDKGQFSFALKADNGQTILRSETYEAKASAQNGVASVQKNSAQDERYERLNAKDGRFYFNLKAGNGQVIGTSQMYQDAGGRDNGIESVKTNGSTTDVRSIDGVVAKKN